MQPVQATLAGSELKLDTASVMLEMEIVWLVDDCNAVRVCVTQFVLPFFKQATSRNVGYAAWTTGTRPDAESVIPAAASSLGQPGTMVFTTNARVELLQAAAGQMVFSHWSIVSMGEPPVARPAKLPRLRQDAAAALLFTERIAAVQFAEMEI